MTESNQPNQAHFIYATVTGNKTKILAEPKRESQVLYEVSNEMVKAWIPEKVQNNGYIKYLQLTVILDMYRKSMF